jgi:hypothetical protein
MMPDHPESRLRVRKRLHVARWLIAPWIAILWIGVAAAQIYQGPSGGSGGNPFDDWAATGGRTDLSAIYLVQDSSGKILCIAAGYGAGPNRKIYPGHGSSCDKITKPPNLGTPNYALAPDEYIIGISGKYGSRVDQLRFYTNHSTQPWVGDKGGNAVFGYSAPHGQMIVAFTGRSDGGLVAIGVMYAPCTPEKNPCR